MVSIHRASGLYTEHPRAKECLPVVSLVSKRFTWSRVTCQGNPPDGMRETQLLLACWSSILLTYFCSFIYYYYYYYICYYILPLFHCIFEFFSPAKPPLAEDMFVFKRWKDSFLHTSANLGSPRNF